jgi:hypothetical protein
VSPIRDKVGRGCGPKGYMDMLGGCVRRLRCVVRCASPNGPVERCGRLCLVPPGDLFLGILPPCRARLASETVPVGALQGCLSELPWDRVDVTVLLVWKDRPSDSVANENRVFCYQAVQQAAFFAQSRETGTVFWKACQSNWVISLSCYDHPWSSRQICT